MTNALDFFNRKNLLDYMSDLFGDLKMIPLNFTNSPKVNVKETDKAYEIEIANPGFSKDETKIEVKDGITGSMMFIMKMESAHFLVNKLMGREQTYNEPFDEMDLSAMKEIGNIIAGSYLSALAGMTNLVISPSVPYIAVDMAASILSVPAIQFGQYGDNALFIETEFGDDVLMDGYFILMPEPESYTKILSALGIQI